MFCPACGSRNDDTSRFCQACGGALTATSVAVAAASPPSRVETMRGAMQPRPAAAAVAVGTKSPNVALILSLVVVGLGQFYNNDGKKGAIMLAGAVVLGIATASIGWFALAIWSAMDAHSVAKGTGKRW